LRASFHEDDTLHDDTETSDCGPEDSTSSQNIADRALRRKIARFQAPRLSISLGQAATSLGGYLAVCAAMYATIGISYWIALALMPLAAGLLVRTFIIQHDCGHRSYFRSKRMNDALGFMCSLFTMTPYPAWRRQHAGHHAIWNNLDRRSSGADFYSTCLTVDEYRDLGRWGQRWYRLTHHALFANILMPPFVFMVLYRIPFDMPRTWRLERLAVHGTNLALAALVVGLGLALGFGEVAMIQVPVIVLASIIGAWLFTVQHRSERVIWARQKDWSFNKASIEGSTHLRLTPILRWFTGNIGLHHIHHLGPRIPNYRLQQCHDAVAEVRGGPVIGLRSAFKAMSYVLWDERRGRMVTIRSAEQA